MAIETQDPPRSSRGLTSAQVRDRVARGAVNTIQEGPSRTTSEIIRSNVVTRFNILLAALLVVILVAVQEPRDALFGIVLITNAAIGIIQELRAKATLDRLAVLTSPAIGVVREGERQMIDIEDIVVDDIVELRTGDQLPVDGTILAARGLEVDESLLTGESDPVLKARGSAALSGSFVVAGTGRYRADRVGAHAYAAALAHEARRFTLVQSELRDGINWMLAGISWAVGPVILLLVIGQMRADFGLVESLRSAVAGAVGMVPQGLVLLTSIAFAVGVIRLGRQQVLVQELPAIEGLARVDTVCFDKTGTLTEGALVVHEVEVLDDVVDPDLALGALGASESDPHGERSPPRTPLQTGGGPATPCRSLRPASGRGRCSAAEVPGCWERPRSWRRETEWSQVRPSRMRPGAGASCSSPDPMTSL
ncbi:MAG: HAD-IC family P-type ATPase [Acidimicrobiia bacterium]